MKISNDYIRKNKTSSKDYRNLSNIHRKEILKDFYKKKKN